MSKRVALLVLILLAAAWLYDMATSQRLVAAILLAVPVAIAGLYLSQRFTRAVIAAALAADAIAGWYNGLQEGGHWDAVSIGNRLLAALTIVLVGVLGAKARAAAQEAGRLAAQQALLADLARKNEELTRVNASLAERGEVIRDIVYALTHDLRTPLAAAAMTLQQAIEGKYGALPAEYQDVLRRSVESNNELRRLADTLLLVARYESGERSTLRQPVALGRIVRSVVEELEPLWAVKQIAVDVAEEQPAQVLGDEGELRRAAVNLMANAIRATPERGGIALRVSRNGQRALLGVEDTGYGITDAQRSTLFERIPASDLTPRGAGSGLGLYIVRRIAEQHGGCVWYRPRSPTGSVFTIELPLAAEALDGR